MSFLKRLFNPQPASPVQSIDSEQKLTFENEIQSLRLELSARDEQIIRLKAEIEHLRSRQEIIAGERSAVMMESLMSELAAPATQLITQADLLENQGKPVQARDILAVARRLIKVLERRGLLLEGTPGDIVNFEPNHHQPLNAGVNPQTGQPVTIRFAGVRYGGKMILKALVD